MAASLFTVLPLPLFLSRVPSDSASRYRSTTVGLTSRPRSVCRLPGISPFLSSLCVVWHYPYEHARPGGPAHHSFAVFVARVPSLFRTGLVCGGPSGYLVLGRDSTEGSGRGEVHHQRGDYGRHDRARAERGHTHNVG